MALGLMPLGSAALARDALTTASGAASDAPTDEAPVGVGLAPPAPASVRMADLVLEGQSFWAGLADGVRLPSQGGDAWSLSAERAGGVYTSPPLQADFPCTHVGVHWRTDGGDQAGLRVELRASRDGQTWMPWRRVAPESHGPDRPARAAETETFG